MPEITVICREVSSPAPPVCPWPLIYSFEVQNLNPIDVDTLRSWIADIRMDEIGLEDEDYEEVFEGIVIDMVFEGNLHPTLDFRQ